jgi:hypothetical protein
VGTLINKPSMPPFLSNRAKLGENLGTMPLDGLERRDL